MRDILAVIGLIVVLSWGNTFCKKYEVGAKLDKIEKFIEMELNV